MKEVPENENTEPIELRVSSKSPNNELLLSSCGPNSRWLFNGRKIKSFARILKYNLINGKSLSVNQVDSICKNRWWSFQRNFYIIFYLGVLETWIAHFIKKRKMTQNHYCYSSGPNPGTRILFLFDDWLSKLSFAVLIPKITLQKKLKFSLINGSPYLLSAQLDYCPENELCQGADIIKRKKMRLKFYTSTG